MPVTGYTNLPTIGNSNMQTGILAGVDLSGGDKTLLESEAVNGRIEVTTGHATNAIIVPTVFAYPGKIYIVANNHATLAALIKVAGGTAITVAALKTAIVQVKSGGTDFARITADV